GRLVVSECFWCESHDLYRSDRAPKCNGARANVIGAAFCAPRGRAYNGGMPMSQNSAHSGGAMHGTTVLCVRKEAKVVLIADGQVTMGDHVMKHTARKTRR